MRSCPRASQSKARLPTNNAKKGKIFHFCCQIAPALKAGYLSFDSTRLSSNDVDFPIDVVLYEKNSYKMKENRYTEYDMKEMSQLWDSKLKQVLNELPEDWMKDYFEK